MKPSNIVFIPTAAMSCCAVLGLYAGHILLAVSALLITCLGCLLVCTLEEAGE